MSSPDDAEQARLRRVLEAQAAVAVDSGAATDPSEATMRLEHVDISLEGLSSISLLPQVVPNVRWVKASDNSLRNLDSLSHLSQLKYLDASLN